MAEDAPEIVLLPGLDGTGDLFERLEQRLAAAMRVTVVRYPQDAGMSYADYAGVACAAIGDRRVALLGESFSGPVAVMTAARLPKQIERLILAATFLRSPWPGRLVRGAAFLDARRAPVWLRDAVLMGRWRDAELSKAVSAIVERLPEGLRAARLRLVAGVDAGAEFSRLDCPILALHGAEDWLVPNWPLKAAVRAKPGAEMAIFPAAHMLLQTRAHDAAIAISKFVQTARAPHETQR